MSSSPNSQHNILLEAGTNELEVIEFVVGKQHFGVNVAKISQVVRWNPAQLTKVREASESIMGVIYHRGKPITLINLRQALAIQGPTVDESRQLVLVTFFNEIFTAFHIDRVNRIHRISWKQLEPFKELMPGTESYVIGTVQIGENLVMILDLEHLVASIMPHIGIQSSTNRFDDVQTNHKREDITVLFAEDSSMIRRLTVEQLKSAGFKKVIAFENGLQAFEKILELDKQAKSNNVPITSLASILLTDIEMPQMDGLTLCKSIKKDLGHADLPVVIYSSLINEQMARKCVAVGSDAHASKPKIEQIILMIDDLCHIS